MSHQALWKKKSRLQLLWNLLALGKNWRCFRQEVWLINKKWAESRGTLLQCRNWLEKEWKELISKPRHSTFHLLPETEMWLNILDSHNTDSKQDESADRVLAYRLGNIFLIPGRVMDTEGHQVYFIWSTDTSHSSPFLFLKKKNLPNCGVRLSNRNLPP